MPKLVVAILDRWSALVPPEDPRARANAVAWRERWLVLANLIDDRHCYYTTYTRLHTDIYSKCLYITTIIHLLSDQDRFNSMSVSTIYYYAHYHTIAHLKILQSDVGDAVESLGRVSVISGLCHWSFNRHLRGRKKGYDGYDCALGTCLGILWKQLCESCTECCTDKKYTMRGDSFWKKALLCIIYSYIPTQAMEPQTTTSKRAREPFFKPSKISKKGCAMMLSAGSKVLAPSYALHKSFPDVKPETLTAVVSFRSGDMTMWTSSRRQW